jgi:hypothetical protein
MIDKTKNGTANAQELGYSLFTGGNTDSVRAVNLLKKCGATFELTHIEAESPDRMDFSTLPTLISGHGYWSGYNSIKSFITEKFGICE